MSLFQRSAPVLPAADEALPGRATASYPVPERHAVLGHPLEGPFPEGLEVAVFALGCFWGAEELYWDTPGVWSTAAGYAGGITPHPTYQEVCTGRTGHAEVVQVVYDPSLVSYDALLKIFWENHDPTQGYRQGNDLGTQYRSAIYTTTDSQRAAAEASRAAYQGPVTAAGYGDITTEILPLGELYLAEPEHQQYLRKVPNGYRCHAKTGVDYPAAPAAPAADVPTR
jgi:peptide-methionine (S)-S-oxide reductase